MEDTIIKNYFHYCLPSISRSVFLATELMEADVGHHFVLKDLARNALTNECTLIKEFKKMFKSKVYRHLQNRRMYHAKHLLHNTWFREKDIALLCGFQSLEGFITSFRKHFGFSPRELRRRLSSVYS